MLPAQSTSTDGYTITIATAATATITLDDVLFGNIFICSGQSNMALTVVATLNATAEAAASASYGDTLRIFQVLDDPAYANVTAPQPNLTASIPWARPTAAQTLGMSAVSAFAIFPRTFSLSKW